MVYLKEYTRHTRFNEAKFDRFYATYDDLKSDRGILLPPLCGGWTVACVDWQLADTETFLKNKDEDVPAFVEVYLYVKKELLQHIAPKKVSDSATAFNEYMRNMIAGFSKVIDDKAVREIWRRCSGDTEQIQTVLAALEELNTNHITINDLNAVIAPVMSVWASDVVFSMFVYHNELVPKKGNILSGFKWKSPFELLTQHRSLLGVDVSFYSIRKLITRLFKAKNDLLRGINVKGLSKREEMLLSVVDVYSLLYATLLFNQSNPKALQSVVVDIVHRQAGYERKVALLHDTLY